MQHAIDTMRPYWPVIMALVGYPLITAALTWLLWWDTPARWDAFVASHPRAALAVRILRAVSPHLRKVVVAYRDWAASRGALPRPSLDAVLPVVPPAAVYAPAIGSLRSATLTGREPSTPPPADGQRGSASVRSLLALVGALTVVTPLGVVVAGCPRMPDVSGCQPQAQTCIADSPHVCSASQRWHRAGAMTCAEVGGSCEVVGGRAYCAAPVVDAGAALAADGGL